MRIYLDTSVVLRVLFGQQPIWDGWARWDEAWTSKLMGLEARRMIDRLRLESALEDEGVAGAHEALLQIEQGLGLVGIDPSVLRQAARSMPTVVKTLDSIHLATAVLLGEEQGSVPEFVTHDGQQAVAARALGMKVRGFSQ